MNVCVYIYIERERESMSVEDDVEMLKGHNDLFIQYNTMKCIGNLDKLLWSSHVFSKL